MVGCSLQIHRARASSLLSVVRLVRSAISNSASCRALPQYEYLHKHLVTASAGFPKDLLYGPSTVLRKDGFGEDAFFVAHHRLADVMGVADGVGGWKEHGVDPSVFSRGLMNHCARLVREGKFSPKHPAHLIASSYKELLTQSLKSKEPLLGSSTACIVILDRDSSQIYTANLGDSGFLVLRNGRVVHRSEEQQHYFNTPFQLSLPPSPEAGQYLSDSPDAADISSFTAKEGDLILVATDGLFDNLPTKYIESEIAKLKNYDQESLQEACNSIAWQARRLANDSNHMSPFAHKANEYGFNATGGKPDDITVLLAVVSSVETEEITVANNECHSKDGGDVINRR